MPKNIYVEKKRAMCYTILINMEKDRIMEHSRYLECGKVIATHGVAGALKIESWCDSPYVLSELPELYFFENGKYIKYEVEKASVFKSIVIAKLAGISTVEDAALRKNMTLYADRDDFELDEGAYFIADLIGLDVIDADTGKVYGKLSEVTNYGASDIYTVKTETGDKMIPAVPEFVIETDLERGIFVRPIEGMFDI